MRTESRMRRNVPAIRSGERAGFKGRLIIPSPNTFPKVDHTSLGSLHHLPGRMRNPSRYHVNKIMVLDFGCCFHELVPKRTMGTDILVALMSHHTASFTARNDALYIN